MRRRLLLIEDDATLRQALAFNLTREGYEVSTAADGVAGLEAGRNPRVDLFMRIIHRQFDSRHRLLQIRSIPPTLGNQAEV